MFDPVVGGTLSVLGSLRIVLIWNDRREKLRKTYYHRLILGLSTMDLLSSLGIVALSGWAVPRDTPFLSIGVARGTVPTCSLLAFFVNLSHHLHRLSLFVLSFDHPIPQEGRVDFQVLWTCSARPFSSKQRKAKSLRPLPPPQFSIRRRQSSFGRTLSKGKRSMLGIKNLILTRFSSHLSGFIPL